MVFATRRIKNPPSARWIRVLTWIGVLLWTFLCAGIFTLLNAGGDLFEQAGGFVHGLAGFFASIGQFFLVFIWLIGIILIFLGGWVLRLFAKVSSGQEERVTVITVDDYEDTTPKR